MSIIKEIYNYNFFLAKRMDKNSYHEVSKSVMIILKFLCKIM